MGIEVALIAGAVAAVAGVGASVVAGNQQRAAARHANDLQQQAAATQRASQYAQQAEQARQQYREDRVRRARIMQQAENSGAEYGSGEIGATGSLQTQYAQNTGNIIGSYNRNVQIGNDLSEANQSIFEGQQRASFTSNIGSIFSAAGSIANTYAMSRAKLKIPGTTSQPTAGT